MLCIDYYEARQRKDRANSWNDCHSRVEVSRQQAQKKICLDFVRALFNTSVWLQAGQYLALAAQIPAKQKSGCPRLVTAQCTYSVLRAPPTGGAPTRRVERLSRLSDSGLTWSSELKGGRGRSGGQRRDGPGFRSPLAAPRSLAAFVRWGPGHGCSLLLVCCCVLHCCIVAAWPRSAL
jgi:hypothetical protein